MKKYRKSFSMILSMLMVLCMVFGAFPLSASAYNVPLQDMDGTPMESVQDNNTLFMSTFEKDTELIKQWASLAQSMGFLFPNMPRNDEYPDLNNLPAPYYNVFLLNADKSSFVRQPKMFEDFTDDEIKAYFEVERKTDATGIYYEVYPKQTTTVSEVINTDYHGVPILGEKRTTSHLPKFTFRPKVVLSPTGFAGKTPKVEQNFDVKPQNTQTVINKGQTFTSQTFTETVSQSSSTTNTTSVTETNSWGGTLSVANTIEIGMDLPGLEIGGSTTITAEARYDFARGFTEEESETQSFQTDITNSFTANNPPHTYSQVLVYPVDAIVRTPYEADVYVDYSVDIIGAGNTDFVKNTQAYDKTAKEYIYFDLNRPPAGPPVLREGVFRSMTVWDWITFVPHEDTNQDRFWSSKYTAFYDRDIGGFYNTHPDTVLYHGLTSPFPELSDLRVSFGSSDGIFSSAVDELQKTITAKTANTSEKVDWNFKNRYVNYINSEGTSNPYSALKNKTADNPVPYFGAVMEDIYTVSDVQKTRQSIVDKMSKIINNRPTAHFDGTLTTSLKSQQYDVSTPLPLYPLSALTLNDRQSINLYEGQSINLDSLKMEALNTYGIPYVGIHDGIKTWSVQNNSNGYVNLRPAKAGGKYLKYLDALKPGTVEIDLTIDQSEYASDGAFTSDRITVHVLPVEKSDLSISGTLDDMYAGDAITLTDFLAGSMKIEGVDSDLDWENPATSAEWFMIGPDIEEPTALSGAVFEPDKPGQYSITCRVGDLVSNPISVLVLEVPRLDSIKIGSSLGTDRIMLLEGDTFDLFDLNPAFKDQYGDDFGIDSSDGRWEFSCQDFISLDAAGHTMTAVIPGDFAVYYVYDTGETMEVDGKIVPVEIYSNVVQFSVREEASPHSFSLVSGETAYYQLDGNQQVVRCDSLTAEQLIASIKDFYGDDYSLGANDIPTLSVDSAETLALVENGVLKPTGAGAGDVPVTVTISHDGISMSATTNVFVGEYPYANTILISAAKSLDIPLRIGANFADFGIRAEVFDQYSNTMDVPVTWESDNANVFIIKQNGSTCFLYGQKDGIANLTAKVGTITSNAMQVTAGKPAPYLVSLEYAVPAINAKPNDTFDMSRFTLTGKDQFGNDFDVSNAAKVYQVIPGTGAATINGSILTATKVGTVSVVVKVGAVTSNPATITILSPTPYLNSISLTGATTTLGEKQTLDLSKMTISTFDQFGNTFKLAKQTKTFEVIQGTGMATIKGSTLTAAKAGTVSVVVKIGTVTSNPFEITITAGKPAPYLSSLTLSGTASVKPDSLYDLNGLPLAGKDQYGNVFSLSGLSKTFELTNGTGQATISGTSLKAVSAGTVTVVAKIGELRSNPVTITIAQGKGKK